VSLTSALNTAAAGISNTDYQIGLANANIANASDTSYSTKTAQITTITDTVAISQATVTRAADSYLTKATVSSASAAGHDAAIDSALQAYDAALGDVSSGDDLASQVSGFQASLTSLTASANTTSAKAAVVDSATQLAGGISALSSSIQQLRTQANSDIASTVDSINTALDSIASLNNQIVSTTAAGGDITNLEDQRDAALETLSSSMGISYYTTADNRLQVYTATGDALVGDSANHLSYTASATLDATSTYPGTISGITLRGTDVTASLTTGTLGGLIQLRDTTLPDEQAKLDELAGSLISTANAASNAGAAYPPPSQLTGTATVAASDSFSGSGTLRVAVTSSTGAVVSTQDLDLSSYSTVADLIGGLNSIPGLTASVSSSGKLVIATADPSQGVALADGGVAVGPAGVGVSDYFGLNDIFTGAGAADIAVNPSLTKSAALLPTAALSVSGGLTVGAVALTAGDSAVADRLGAALTASTSFTAAGDFPAQTVSLATYASNIVSSAASLISNASDQADRSDATHTAAQTQLENVTSVNTDEQLSNLTLLQQQYQANAQMVTTVRTLFTALLQMMQAT
jgi:flagellar hook-associated protein 1 FlgK